jgi:FkbM family methyltransferase
MTAWQPLIRFNLLPLWRRKVRVWGHEISGRSLDRLVYLHLHRYGWMGREERRFLEEIVQPGMRVIDVGANIGLYTLLLSQLVGESGHVVAMEPDPELFECLKANCERNQARNVELHNAAAGASASRMVLSRSLINAGDNRLAPNRTPSLTRQVDVRVTTIDEIVAQRAVDFIKIDVQGWEAQVFEGMQEVFRANPGIQLLFEYWPYGLERAKCEPKGILRPLDARGFQLLEISGKTRAPITDLAAWKEPGGSKFTNLYAVRKLSTPLCPRES